VKNTDDHIEQSREPRRGPLSVEDYIEQSREPSHGPLALDKPGGGNDAVEIYRNVALADRQLSGNEKVSLLAALPFADYGGNGKVALGNCFPSRKLWAKWAGMSIHSLDRAIEGLTRKGYIERIPFRHIQSKRRTVSLIRFRLPPCEEEPTGWEGPIRYSNRQGIEPIPAPRNSNRAGLQKLQTGASEGDGV
jgi:hypothetical protein